MYTQVQTYATCGRFTLANVLKRYRETLEEGLGCTDEQALTWLTEVSWPRSDDDSFGDIYAAPVTLAPVGFTPIVCIGIEVSLYTKTAVPSVEEQPVWVGFNLLFESSDLKESEIAIYRPEVGKTLWHILLELFRVFPELGAYFTNEWQENLPWFALAGRAGNPWTFEMGIFPRALSQAFIDVPAGYKGTVIDGGFGFAQENRWQLLPWLEA